MKNFSIQSNAQDFGNFDDVVIDITLKDGSSENYAIQLKHKENDSKKLLPSNFEARGDFDLEKYCRKFKELSEEKKQQYHFIIYTNRKFNSKSKNEAKDFSILSDSQPKGENFLNTSSSCNNLYKFETKINSPKKQDYDEFFPKLGLYTNQDDFNTIKNKILSFFSQESQGLTYIELFRKWHQGNFTNKMINLETVVFHVIKILLFNGMITNKYLPNSNNLKLFKEAVQQFNVTIIDDSANNFSANLQIEKNFGLLQLDQFLDKFNISSKSLNSDNEKKEGLMRLAKDFKIVEKTAKELNENEVGLIESYFFRKLLVINSRKIPKEDILGVTEIQTNGKQETIKLILLCESFDTSLECSVFQNLEDLRRKNEDLYFRIITASKVSFQGRDEISLSEFVTNFEEIPYLIKAGDIFHLLQNDCFLIGEERKQLPAYYVKRKLKTNVLDFDTLVKCVKNKENIVIVDFQDLDIKRFEKCGIAVTDFSDYIKSPTSIRNPFVIVASEEHMHELFEAILNQKFNKHIHYLKTVEDNFLLIRSTNNIFRSNNSQKKNWNEEKIHFIMNGPINIICAEPGMGKTTTMNYLKNTCPNNYWTIGIDLKAHNLFLKKPHTFEEVLKHFLITEKNDGNNLKKIFLKRKQIVLFFDGLDELDNDSVENVLNHIEKLLKKGFRMWVSSRENLKSRLESRFNVFVTEIVELNEEEQKNFINDRLYKNYNNDEIELLIEKISSNTKIINNQHFLGIPLQLYIITEIFLNKKYKIKDLEENMFVLTKMYQCFFEGRYEHLKDKLESPGISSTLKELQDYLDAYKLIAMQSVFESEVLKHLHLNLQQSERFLKNVKDDKDPLGIIINVDKEGKGVFEHYTYAEYFACLHLRNKFENARLLKEQLFSSQYKNLKLIFSIMLAEESPLHLAIIHENFEKIRKLMIGENDDFGGRNPLQVAVSFFKRYFTISNNKNEQYGNIQFSTNPFTFYEKRCKQENIIKALIIKFNPYKKDLLFNENAFYLAVLKNNLFALELFLEHYGMTDEAFVTLKQYKYVNNMVIVEFCIELDYPNLLAVALEKKNSQAVREINLDKISIYAFTLTPRIIRLLIYYGVKINDEELLKHAIKRNNCELVNYLLDCYENTNNTLNKTDLFKLAAESKSWNVFTLFAEKGWKINKDMVVYEKSLSYCIIEEKKFELVELIFEKQSNLNRSSLVTLLHKAIKNKDFEMINYLLKIGIDVNIKNNKGQNAMHLAVKSNCSKIVKLILEKEPELIEDKFGKTPTGLALVNNNMDIVRLLPVDKNKNRFGQTLLHLASKRGNTNMVKYVYNKIKGENEKDNKGLTPIFYAVRRGYFELFDFFRNCEAHLDVVTNDGKTLLHWAAEGGNCEIIKCLLGKCLDKEAQDNGGKTPLMWAAERYNLDSVQCLIREGAKINSSDMLRCAIKNGWPDVIKLLLKYEPDILKKDLHFKDSFVDVKLEDVNRVTPLSLAIGCDKFEVAKLLLDHGVNVNDIEAFYKVSVWKDIKYLKLLFDKGLELKRVINSEQELFDGLIKDNNFEAINLLLSNNAQPNIKEIFWKAIDSEKLPTIELCIEKGVDINTTNEEGETGLLYACKAGKKKIIFSIKLKIIQFFVKIGADVNCISTQTETIWYYLHWYEKDLIELIFSKNVDADLEDKWNNTPLYYALKNKYEKGISELQLRTQKFNINALLCAIETENVASIQWFFQKGFQPQIKKYEGSIMPLVGKATNNTEIMKLFLSNNLDINASNIVERYETALFCAIRHQNLTMAKYLISNNANVNCISFAKETIWEYLNWNNEDLIDLIMSKNVNPELANFFNFTPLFYAIYYKDIKSVTSLLASHGFNISELWDCDLLTISEMLKEKSFPKTSNVIKIFGNNFLNNANLALKKVVDLYVRLHFAVYLGNVTEVKSIIKESIDFQDVDKYNSILPLHFAVKDGFLNSKLLTEKTKWISNIYKENTIWSLEDIHKSLLER